MLIVFSWTLGVFEFLKYGKGVAIRTAAFWIFWCNFIISDLEILLIFLLVKIFGVCLWVLGFIGVSQVGENIFDAPVPVVTSHIG